MQELHDYTGGSVDENPSEVSYCSLARRLHYAVQKREASLYLVIPAFDH